MEAMTEQKDVKVQTVVPDGRFTERIGNTTFEVEVFFNKHSKESY